MTATLLDQLERSRDLGFLGPGPVERHLEHATAFAAAIDHPPARALDLGAGGGLPGLVLAATTWPETRWTFLDAQTRRTDFLREAVERLGLEDRVTVVTERAEIVGRDPHHRGGYPLVVARSFAAPAVAAECAAPLLVVGGWLVVSEPPNDARDLRWPTDALDAVGLGPAQPLTVEAADEPVHLVRLELQRLPDARFPRRVGVPAKRPLF